MMKKEAPMPADDGLPLAERCAAYALQLLQSASEPVLPEDLAGIEGMATLHDYILGLRHYVRLLAEGDISQEIPQKGFLPGYLKAHISNLRHMTWQVDQVSKGDYTQRVDFLGDFSTAFNNMAEQLDRTVKDLHNTQASLTQLTKNLRQEVELRSAAVHALKQSKARFKYLADHDPLTGALNRRSFLALAETGIRQAKENFESCCVAMLDVDHFKQFNDTYGHLDGDKALKHLVGIGAMSLRQKDSMGRYGGEEFIFFFSGATLDIGMRVGERILQAVRTTPLSLACGNVYLTASMGLSVIHPDWEGERNSNYVQRAIGMADEALYQAKQQGRDRISAAPEEPPAISSESGSDALACLLSDYPDDSAGFDDA